MRLFNRRDFLLMWIARPAQAETMSVEVLEVFRATNGQCALLFHHSASELRLEFSTWLHRFDGAQVDVRASRIATRATMFRVKMCFGRGLLLMPQVLNVGIKDRLQIEIR